MKLKCSISILAFLMSVSILAEVRTTAKTSKSVLDKLNVVATSKKIRNSELICCDINQLKMKFNLPLSELIENLQMVKLDIRDEALVDNSFTTVTDNYILVRNKKQNPYKLFDKKGKFLSTIGAYGQGPNEYLNVYDDFVDEKNKRIYILPWQSNKVLVYDFTGKAYAPIILPTRVPKGKLYVDPATSTIALAQLPFKGESMVAWTQGFKSNGKAARFVKPGNLSIKPDFSNELFSNKNTGAFDVFLFTFFELRPDTLYNYQYKNNVLLPKFTLDFKNKPIKIHGYAELPRHFTGDLSVEVKLSDNLSTTEKPACFIVDKKTKKGGFYTLFNDFMGNMPVDWLSCNNGYFVMNIDPGELLDKISNQLKTGKMTENQRQKLSAMEKSINENDNNYIFYGKLKK